MAMTRRISTLGAVAALAAAAGPATLAAAPAEAKVTSSLQGSVLVLQGGKGKDRATVRCGADGDVRVNGKRIRGPVACSRVSELNALMEGGDDVVDFSGVGPEFGEARFEGFGTGTGAAALLGEGDDRLIASASAFNLAFGEGGNDRANGGRAKDVLVGGGGRDVLNGASGRDSLQGNAGDDRLAGGAGADIVSGNAGNDLLLGGPGADVLGGGTGRDRLRGGSGRDQLFGGAGRDELSGGAGRDQERQDRSASL